MNILNLISKDTGIIYKKKSNTHGGEYAGPCPWCLGDDRFGIYPAKDHYVCRRCKKAGDSIQFVKEYLSKTYMESCSYLGINPNINFKSLNAYTDKPGQNEIIWEPRKIEHPSQKWQDKAESFLFECYKTLLSPVGKKHRIWLNERGIKNETIKIARLGLNLAHKKYDAKTWGVVSENDKSSNTKLVHIPVGLLIPQYWEDKLIRLRVRQDNPFSSDRFIVILGSANGYFNYDKHTNYRSSKKLSTNRVTFTTEAELDGWLIWQEAKDIVEVRAIGNVSSRPDSDSHKNLSTIQGLLNLDNDEAGVAEQAWWNKHYKNIIPYLSKKKKDPGEDYEAGINIRNWVKTGLKLIDQPEQKIYRPSQVCSQENFRDKVLARKKLSTISQSIDQPGSKNYRPSHNLSTISSMFTGEKKVKSKTPINKQCIHGLYCASKKDTICLVSKEIISDDMGACPRDFWYIAKQTEHLFLIVLGPGVSKRKM